MSYNTKLKQFLDVRNQRKTLQEQERILWRQLLKLQNIEPKEPEYEKKIVSLEQIKKLNKILDHNQLNKVLAILEKREK